MGKDEGMTSGIYLLLLQMTDDPQEADQAWVKMLTWAPPFAPSQMQRQCERAVEIVRGVNPGCRNDPTNPKPHSAESNPPLGPGGMCVQCGQPKIEPCTCTKRFGHHAKHCKAPAYV